MCKWHVDLYNALAKTLEKKDDAYTKNPLFRYEESSNDKKQLTPRRRRVGYPPITPNASIKDSVISSAFDAIWQEVKSVDVFKN